MGFFSFLLGVYFMRGKKTQPNQQRTLNNLPNELRCRNFVTKHQLSILQIGTKRAKTCTCNVYIFQLSFHFGCHRWWLGSVVASYRCTSGPGRRASGRWSLRLRLRLRLRRWRTSSVLRRTRRRRRRPRPRGSGSRSGRRRPFNAEEENVLCHLISHTTKKSCF